MTTQQQSRILTEEVRVAKQRRLDQLEIQAATYGLDVPPHISTEIADLQSELELVFVMSRPALDPRLRRVLAETDNVELLGKFIGAHARRLTDIETWQSKRDEKLLDDDKSRNQQRHKLDLVMGALIVVAVINTGFNLVVMVVLLISR